MALLFLSYKDEQQRDATAMTVEDDRKKKSLFGGKRADSSNICIGVGDLFAPEDDFIIELSHEDGKASGHWSTRSPSNNTLIV